MRAKPDNRADNVKKIQTNINNTIQNIRETEKVMRATDSAPAKADLQAKNERREDAIYGLRKEIKDEANFQKQQ